MAVMIPAPTLSPVLMVEADSNGVRLLLVPALEYCQSSVRLGESTG